jgi:hypothetical protein
MQRLLRVVTFAGLSVLFNSGLVYAQAPTCTSSVPFGNNAANGHFATLNGIRLYYETYGAGPAPLLSLEDLSEEENESIWAQEAERRDTGWNSSAVRHRSAKSVLRRAKT